MLIEFVGDQGSFLFYGFVDFCLFVVFIVEFIWHWVLIMTLFFFLALGFIFGHGLICYFVILEFVVSKCFVT